MKKYTVTILALLLMFASVDAKFGGGSFSGGGSRSFSSSRPSTSFSSSKPSASPSFSTNKTTSSFGATKSNAVDSKMAQGSATAGRGFTSKADAESAYRSKLVTQSTYTSPTPPAMQPSYVPHTVVNNGHTVNVIYHQMPGGGYGYGYYNPMTNAFVALAATEMVLDAQRQSEVNAMYAQQLRQDANQYQQPPPQDDDSNVWIVVLMVIVVAVAGIAIFAKWA